MQTTCLPEVLGPERLYHSEEIAQVTPQPVAEIASALAAIEARESERAAAAMEEAWGGVERFLSACREREERLASLQAAIATGFDDVHFWDADLIQAQFGLAPPTPTATTEELLGDPLLVTVAQRDRSPEAKATLRQRVVSGKATAAETATLAPASERLAPIRRCFTDILRRRDTVPKEFTLLLNGIAELQKRALPMEERMRDSQFNLPLHVPFQSISNLVTSTLIPQGTGEEIDRWITREVDPVLRRLESNFQELSSSNEPKAIHELLQTETSEREHLDSLSTRVLSDATHVERSMRDAFTVAHGKASDRCDRALDFIRDQARMVTESARDLVDETNALDAKGTATCETQLAALRRQLQEAEHRRSRARRNQESAVRQVREALKVAKREQSVHERAMAECVRLQTDIARLDRSRAQFQTGCVERREVLEDAYQACLFVNDIIADVTSEVHKGLALCQQHISRFLATEAFRKARVARLAMANAREWYRCVGDLQRIRRQRLADIEARMAGSWQLEFLLQQEAEDQRAVLAEYDSTLGHIDQRWSSLTGLLVELEVHVPVLHQYDKDADVVRLRQRLLAVEGLGKDRDLRAAQQRVLDRAMAAAKRKASGAGSEGRQLPPVPPPRNSKPRPNRHPHTGVRRVPDVPETVGSSDQEEEKGDGRGGAAPVDKKQLEPRASSARSATALPKIPAATGTVSVTPRR